MWDFSYQRKRENPVFHICKVPMGYDVEFIIENTSLLKSETISKTRNDAITILTRMRNNRNANNFEMLQTRDRKFYFVQKALNHQVIAISVKVYDTMDELLKDIDSIMEYIQNAKIKDHVIPIL